MLDGCSLQAGPPAAARLGSCACTQHQLESPNFRWWAQRLGEPFRLHRKLWEFCYIAQALHERGMLAPGKRGLGFAVGQEPLSALFASYGCEIVATDLHPERSDPGWITTNQHASSIEQLQRPSVCPPDLLRQRVTFRFVDMNDIPADLTGFDFVWSACSFEHLGSLGRGRRFLRRMARCLKPGGVAVHTTEFNVCSNFFTLWRGNSVIYRRRDLEKIVLELRELGHTVEPLNFETGNAPADLHIDEPPYPQQTHLKLRLRRFVTTSFGIIMQAGQHREPQGWSHWLPWRRAG